MSSEIVLARVAEIIATMFNVPADSVTPDSSSENIENWDSMGQLMLVLELEQHFGVQLSPEDVEKITDVQSAVDLLVSKGAR